MLFKNAMSYKAKINQIAKQRGLEARQIQHCYLIEAFLVKLSLSRFKDNFIIKGGYLIGSVVGLGNRTTIDLDVTVKRFSLTLESISEIIKEIIMIPSEESFKFDLININEIRKKDEYKGFEIKLCAQFEKVKENVSIDITTGDIIIPGEVIHEFDKVFDERKLNLLTYPIETIFAEKVDAILSRGSLSTRPRDYYDVYILFKLDEYKINYTLLTKAIKNTMEHRKSLHKLDEYNKILQNIVDSEFQINQWNKYQKQYNYAKNLSLEDVMKSVKTLLNRVLDI